MEKNILQTELDYFESQRAELLGKAKDEFVLIKEENIIDTFKSKDDAIKRGYQEFGNAPFLVKQITEFDDSLNFTNLLLSA